MMGHLVSNNVEQQPAHFHAPLLPAFVRRALAALFRRQ